MSCLRDSIMSIENHALESATTKKINRIIGRKGRRLRGHTASRAPVEPKHRIIVLFPFDKSGITYQPRPGTGLSFLESVVEVC